MIDLVNFTASDVLIPITAVISEDFGITKAEARKLLLNALTYNCVIEEIEGQVAALLGMGYE